MIPYRDENETIRTPVVTFAIIAINVAVWLLVQGAGSERPLAAREVSRGFVVPQLALALACVGIGLLPALIVPPFLRVATTIAGVPPDHVVAVLHDVVLDTQRLALFGAVLLVTCVTAYAARQWLLRRRPVRTGATWSCAYDDTTPRMQYTASSFAAPLLAVFGSLTGVREHRGGTVFHSTPRDLVLDDAVVPIWWRIKGAALRLRPIQQGRLHVYLLYAVAALVGVLAYLMATS